MSRASLLTALPGYAIVAASSSAPEGPPSGRHRPPALRTSRSRPGRGPSTAPWPQARTGAGIRTPTTGRARPDHEEGWPAQA